MATIRSYTDIEQSRKLAEILPLESADYFHAPDAGIVATESYKLNEDDETVITAYKGAIPCWSLAALLKLIPKHILRKDKAHCEQTFIPSFRWEITPTAIYYTDGNDIMDYVSFRYGENNIELIDAVFKMVVWLKEKGLL